VEARQAETAAHLTQVRSGLAEGTTLTRSLTETTEALRRGLTGAQEALSALRAQDQERLRQLTDATTGVRRLEQVIAGAQSKGAAGEHLVEQILGSLPPEWIERDYTIGGGRVEFALRLPNQLIVPIDSKWPSTSVLDQLQQETDPAKLGKLRDQVERMVLAKAREVTTYLEPGTTAGFAIAAVPDGVFSVCHRAPAEALKDRVAIVSYSLLVPYLLIVIQSALKASATADLELLASYLQAATEAAGKMREEVEGRLSRGVTMLENSRDDLRAELASLQASLTGVRQGEARLLATTPEATSFGS
jgi:DNA recombination protein RmuC